MNPRSASFLYLLFDSKRHSIFFVSFPSSGWNWMADVLTYVLGKKYLDEFNIDYAQEADTLKEAVEKPFELATPADARTASYKRPYLRDRIKALNIDYCFHTHGNWKESPIWGLDAARTIFLTRNIPTTLYSYYQKNIDDYADNTFYEYLHSPFIDRLVNYHNSWGQFMNKENVEYRIFTYEGFRQNPVQRFHELAEYCFQRKFSKDLVREAVDYYAFDRQKSREQEYTENEDKHFHFKGSLTYYSEMDRKSINYILDVIDKRIDNTFGYTYPRKQVEFSGL